LSIANCRLSIVDCRLSIAAPRLHAARLQIGNRKSAIDNVFLNSFKKLLDTLPEQA
jgi:hypothetical protein